MKFHYLLFAMAAFQLESGSGFVAGPIRNAPLQYATELSVKSRKARRKQKAEKQARGRSKQFYDAIEDAQGKETQSGGNPPDDDDESQRQAIIDDAQSRMDARPEVSRMIVDEETGFEVLQQGKNVMDVVTRKAVKLSDMGPEYRLAQMFPGVPPEVREKHRFDWNTVEVPEMVEKLRAACSVKLEDGSTGIPPQPSIANEGLDFVLANRDLLGRKMEKTLGRLTMRAAWLEDEKATKENNALWRNFLTLENHISAPFRQILQDAEGRIGPNFGNLELKKYCGNDLYERVGDYIVLKGMVAHWEKKVVDADYIEKTPVTRENQVSVLCRGDPKRELPDPPILFSVKECTQVCAMAQQMCQLFVEDEELFADLPPEIVFLEDALKIKGGTALRKYMIDEFCPQRGITPEGLREGMRRFFEQLNNMQIDPYADLTNKVEALFSAMAVGTDEQRDPYTPYLGNVDPNGPGYFQTYTFNHPKQSIVRFLDNQYPSAGENNFSSGEEDDDSSKDEGFLGGLSSLFGGGDERSSGGPVGSVKSLRSEPKAAENKDYKVPEERAVGRPHEMGWLEKIEPPEVEWVRMEDVPVGKIITEA